jgi:hypothetical protein
MENKRNSHRRRDAIRDLVTRLGINRREAGQILSGQQPPVDLHPKDLVYLDAPELPKLIEQLVNKRPVGIDTYTPVELVEGHIEQQQLSGFRVRAMEIEDAYIDDPNSPHAIGVDLIATGTGDVDWHVTNPTAGDVHAHESEMEGLEDGPGLWQGREELAPFRLLVHAQYTTNTMRWMADEIRSVDIDSDEARRRGREHDREDTRRQQALGLLPTDDELDAMAERAEKEHAEELSNGAQSLLEGIHDDVLLGDFLAGDLTWELTAARESDSEETSATRTVIRAQITIARSAQTAADIETLRAWIEQNRRRVVVALAKWEPRPTRDGDERAVIDAVFVYSPPPFDSSKFRRRW